MDRSNRGREFARPRSPLCPLPISVHRISEPGRFGADKLTVSPGIFFFYFITLGLELSDTKVYEP